MDDDDGAAPSQASADTRPRVNTAFERTSTPSRALPRSSHQSRDASHDYSHNAKYDLSPDIPQSSFIPSIPKIQSNSHGNSLNSSGRQRSSKDASADRSRWRNLKVRHNGGFLLSDMQSNVRSTSAEQKGKEVAANYSSHGGLGIGNRPGPIPHSSKTHSLLDKGSGLHSSELHVRGTRSAYSDRPDSADTDNSATSPSVGTDTAQIVDMALRINQNRRIASQRSAIQQLPPRLMPLPDTNASETLRHHLQQQRKLSRTSSPRPERMSGQRFPSASGKSSLPIQPGFDHTMPFEVPYRYNLSQSTLARVQKARQHLELMAHYRNLHNFLPPIPTRAEAKNMISPPHTPGGTTSLPAQSSESSSNLGRQYNPLQYIRNRKIRARERKAVYGEILGFANVSRVAEWVQEVAQRATQGSSVASDDGSLPPFQTAEERAHETAASIKQHGSNKPRRPRLEWEMEPADMIADIYWLEKGNNKQYMQDREWRPIFPPSSFPPTKPQSIESLNGISRQNTDVNLPSLSQRVASKLLDGEEHGHHHYDMHDSKHGFDNDHSHSKTAKARHKLHTFKLAHKYSNPNVNHHDAYRRSRNSLSEDSESEVDARFRRPNRSNTLTSQSKDILEKQMREIIAREMEQQKQQQEREQYQPAPQPPVLSSPISSDRMIDSVFKPISRIQSRPGSLLDSSEAEDRFPGREMEKKASIYNHGHRPGITTTARSSLEVPRQSFDMDQSRPVTPNSDIIEASDSSRPSSPSRNPFHRVKSILRDRSKERFHEQICERVPEEPEIMQTRTTSTSDLKSGFGRRGSSTPVDVDKEKDVLEMTRLAKKPINRLDGTNSSVRGMLKTPGLRIDNVIRGGFSKLGGLIWRKTDSDSDSESSDDKDCGRFSRNDSDCIGESEPRDVKSKQDCEARNDGNGLIATTPVCLNGNEDSWPHIDALKPPRIDIQAASPLSNCSRAPSTSSSDSLSSEVKSHEPSAPLIVHIPPWVQSASDGPIALRPRQPKEGSLARSFSPSHSPISRYDLARLRTLILSSAIKAREFDRMSSKPQFTFVESGALPNMPSKPSISIARSLIHDVCRLSKTMDSPLAGRCVSIIELHHLAAQTYSQAQASHEAEWQRIAAQFSAQTTVKLHAEIEAVRSLITADLLQFTRRTADEADEASRGMAMSQGLKAKRVEESIEKMLRRKRRRFRWLRRGMWLGLEWVLIGIMWYVWFVVTIMQIVLGVGKGVVRGVRWLFWL
ncbi:hypothetical protein Cpir12675_001474 [Ceratocystis pirilliformis]|uniref:Uncharacterized protein n=1 Tax=Ceratocystis pirilliformis TaxID=259994 RepID=A0ABR3ZF79_9PEZI